MYSDDFIRPWQQAVLDLVPGVDLFDAHTHTGANDPDGMRCSVADLIAGLETAGARSVVFTMHEPDGYREANDRIVEEAAASGGRLVPFCRVDPADGALAEAERALDRGARGVKLHPRAENFRLGDQRLESVYAMAEERGVPVLTHAGRGIPALGRDALDITAKHPGLKLILAHDGVSDLAWIWRHAADHPNLLFDTAWWSVLDHLTLFGMVPPGQILFASDMPYGTTLLASILSLRSAFQAGLSAEQVRQIAGGQLERILDGQDTLDLGPAPGDGRLAGDLVLARVYSYLVTAMGRMFLGDDTPDYVGLARLACEVGDDAPQAPVCASVLALLDRMQSFVDSTPDTRPPAKPGQMRPYMGVQFVVVAAAVAMTPDVALPDVSQPVDVAERTA
jgi:predicted TIM-barrel fold metal-dependent hydrolase